METSPGLAEAREYKNELLARMLASAGIALPFTAAVSAREATAMAIRHLPPEVQGVGFGAKVVEGGGIDEQLAVRVYVRAKKPRYALSQSEAIPTEVNGLPTDVVVVGDIVARARPTPWGVSVGHFRITAGTLGCLVRMKGDGGPPLILSNNHVLADCNRGVPGDPILEPGPIDGGDPSDPIAELVDFEPFDFAGVNSIDAAVARLHEPASVFPLISTIGPVRQPVIAPSIFQSVRKHGRTTLHTLGAIVDLAADIMVGFPNGSALFDDQLAVTGTAGAFSAGGDSGSLVVDAVSSRPVGLLFAGGTSGGVDTTFVNRITGVIDRFRIDIL